MSDRSKTIKWQSNHPVSGPADPKQQGHENVIGEHESIGVKVIPKILHRRARACNPHSRVWCPFSLTDVIEWEMKMVRQTGDTSQSGETPKDAIAINEWERKLMGQRGFFRTNKRMCSLPHEIQRNMAKCALVEVSRFTNSYIATIKAESKYLAIHTVHSTDIQTEVHKVQQNSESTKADKQSAGFKYGATNEAIQ